jgi:hypothetical protein
MTDNRRRHDIPVSEGGESRSYGTRAASTAALDTRGLRSLVANMTAEQKDLRRELGMFKEARAARFEAPKWEARASKGGHAGLIVAQLTDTHWDEVVKPEEIFDLNAYNRRIALARFKLWVEKVITLPRDYFAGVRIEGLVIPATGDLLSGDIHLELKQHNEDQLLASVLFWSGQVLSALETLESEYPAVSVHAVVGNHGRLSVKPIFVGRPHDNVEWLLWSIVRDRLADRGSKVVVEVSDSADLNVPLYGRNHLLTHGDQFHGGSGISGPYSPLMLGQHRKGIRQAAAKMPMDLMVLGHLHQFIDIPGLIMGGSMVGYNSYAFLHNLRPELARQALWVTTPERGKIMSMPVELQDRKAEGW